MLDVFDLLVVLYEKNWVDPEIHQNEFSVLEVKQYSTQSLCVRVHVCMNAGEEFQGEDELDKELLWNLQLLSEVRRGSITSRGLQKY